MSHCRGIILIIGLISRRCACSFANVYVPIIFKNKKGKILRTFEEPGLQNVESAILWVWRDLFLATLASDNAPYVNLMPDLLSDVDDIMGWEGLEQLLLGGMSRECTYALT